MKPRSAKLTRNAAVATAALTLALGAVACGKDSGSSATTAASSGSAADRTTASTGADTAGTGSTGGTGLGSTGGAADSHSAAAGTGSTQASARCHTGELKADVQIQQAGAAMVMLTNKGSRSCTVFGYLGYGGLLADNSKATLPTNRVAHPGPPTPVTLKPGTTAFSGLKWTGCDKGDVSCKVLGAIVVTPPDETTQLTATLIGLNGKDVPQLTVSATGFTVGSLQPSNQGVVLP